MRAVDSLFYPEQRVTGHVTAMNDWFATINIQGQALPLENHFISWQFIDKPSDHLRLGERIHAVVHSEHCKDSLYRCRTLLPSVFWHGFWLDCLPLLDDPWPMFKEHYPVGSVLELEFLDYTNFYTAHARTESGLVIELMNSDLHSWGNSSDFVEPLQSHQFIRIAIRQFSARTVRSKRLQ